jgi:ribonuclease BN (tRNA processing enzyme)
VKLVVLGSGGWIPTGRRETCCYALRRDADVLILDAGSGLRRLLDRPDVLAGARSLRIVLSHFHLDHVVGLSYLPALDLPEDFGVVGPGRELYGISTREILGRLLESPFFPAGLTSVVSDVLDLGEGTSECGGFGISTRTQQLHSEPTLAIRVEDALTYCTDTAFDAANSAFARGSHLLLHEAWHTGTHTDDGIHSAAGEAAVVAREAAVTELLLIHIDPLLDTEETLAADARLIFDKTRVAADLDSLALT